MSPPKPKPSTSRRTSRTQSPPKKRRVITTCPPCYDQPYQGNARLAKIVQTILSLANELQQIAYDDTTTAECVALTRASKVMAVAAAPIVHCIHEQSQ